MAINEYGTTALNVFKIVVVVFVVKGYFSSPRPAAADHPSPKRERGRG
jgi:hypothetical protein